MTTTQEREFEQALAGIAKLDMEEILSTAPPAICVLGEDALRRVSEQVNAAAAESEEFMKAKLQLHRALHDFRASFGYGRSIAAPQVGDNRRYVAINLGTGAFTMINPSITWRSEDTFTMWDDCLSLPELLVRVRRSSSVSVSFLDDAGRSHHWEHCDRAVSELLQHEIDHLDGVLMIDRMDGPLHSSLVYRAAFLSNPSRFKAQVDDVSG